MRIGNDIMIFIKYKNYKILSSVFLYYVNLYSIVFSILMKKKEIFELIF